MVKKIAAFLTLALLFLGPSCRRPVGKGELIRLLDSLRLQDIRKSPFLDPQTAALKNIFFPVNSILLPDEGAGQNPFGLKRKVHYGGADFNILFAPPYSEYVIGLEPQQGLRLDFGIGIKQDANAAEVRGNSGGLREQVTFAIIFKSSKGEKTVFSKSLRIPPSGPESRLVFAEHNITLPKLDSPSRVAFRTRGAPNAFAFWMNPVFYRRADRPVNVVLISLDTLRPDHLGCYGYGRPTGPSIDALAEESVLFRRAYAPSSWTLPSHVSMLTGLNTVNHGVSQPQSRMDPAIVTLADRLRREGFFCAAFTGGGFLSPRYGFSKGFDFYSEADGSFDVVDSAEKVSASACRWLETRGERRFFLFVHTYQIHGPYSCPPPYNRMFLEKGAEWDKLNTEAFFKDYLVYRPLSQAQRRNIIELYDGEIRYTDDKLIKPLIETLRRLGLYEHTLLILTSDHGEEFYEHGAWVHGRQLYEESIRVPLLFKFPGGRFKGRKVDGPVRLIDIMPTILDILDIDRAAAGMDGTSLLPAVKKGRSEDRPVLVELELDPKDTIKKSLIQGWNKIIRNDFINRPALADNACQPPRRPPLEFYRLADDPEESKNVIDQEPMSARNMADLLRVMLKSSVQRARHRLDLEPALREKLRALGYIH
jgi:arylsulfatase A-like enzyme